MDKNKTRVRESCAMNVKAFNIFRLIVQTFLENGKGLQYYIFYDESDEESKSNIANNVAAFIAHVWSSSYSIMMVTQVMMVFL